MLSPHSPPSLRFGVGFMCQLLRDVFVVCIVGLVWGSMCADVTQRDYIHSVWAPSPAIKGGPLSSLAYTETSYDTTLLGQSYVLITTGYALGRRNMEKQINYYYCDWGSSQRAVGLESGAERAVGGPLSGGSCGFDKSHLRLKGAF
jgi:hypothetical protein